MGSKVEVKRLVSKLSLPSRGRVAQGACLVLNMLTAGIYFILDITYLFLDRAAGRQKEKKRNINVWLPFVSPLLGTWPTTQACDLTGNRTSDPLLCRPALNPLSHNSWDMGIF